MTTSTTPRSAPSTERLSDVVIRFAGDSGDGMQLTGTQFTSTSAFLGNDLSTLPDFPAEIRAPAGTLPGVSAFQIRIADFDIHTPGDSPNVLVAMNPAALKVNLIDLERGGVLVVDTDEFTTRNLKRIGYETNPLEDGSLDGYRVFALPLTTLTKQAVAEAGLDTRNQIRCKNFYALGMCYWLFSRSLEHTERWLAKKFAGKAQLLDGNLRALRAGWTYCDVTEAFQVRYEVEPAKLEPGLYRNVNGNQALAWGLVAGGRLSGLPVFLGSYPITPASDLLHTLAGMRRYGVTTFQAEDEIAAVCAAIGAAFGGALGVTSTSGPGLALKMEAINLAVMTELPLVVVDVMRAGPSTGMPTKTEQSDLLQALFGRNGESPVAVVAPGSPGDCFTIAIEACRLAVEYRVPVIVLSDGYLGNGAEPWRVPSVADLPRIEPNFTTNPEGFQPYSRDPETLARPWAIPGTPGLEHRIGGLEKADGSGNVSSDARNHEKMVGLRAEKIQRMARSIAPLAVDDPDGADLLVLGWGSTEGAIMGAVNEARRRGHRVARAHLRHLSPFPANLGEVLRAYRQVLLPEMNSGQLALVLQGQFLVPITSYPKVQGKPFFRNEIVAKIEEVLGHG